MCLHRMLLTILAETAESLDFATRRWQFYRFSCVFINGVDPHTTSPTRLSKTTPCIDTCAAFLWLPCVQSAVPKSI